MAEEAPKSWWQTMAGVMTGIAALITAIAGLVAALNKAGLIGPSEQLAPVPTSPARGPSQPASPDTERLPELPVWRPTRRRLRPS